MLYLPLLLDAAGLGFGLGFDAGAGAGAAGGLEIVVALISWLDFYGGTFAVIPTAALFAGFRLLFYTLAGLSPPFAVSPTLEMLIALFLLPAVTPTALSLVVLIVFGSSLLINAPYFPFVFTDHLLIFY